MRLNTTLRRARRRGFLPICTSIRQQFQRSNTPTKHVKIDDEERDLEDQHWSASNHHHSPLSHMMMLAFLSLLGLLVVVLILGYTVYKPPKFLIDFFQRRNPDVLFQVPTTQRVVALTLDDAPSSETAKLLDLLKTYEAKATFFVIGSQISERPDILERIRDEGHEIGNHAWADEPSIQLSIPELKRQITEVESLLPMNLDGAKYFRAGSGIFNQKMVDTVKSMGYRMVLGGIFPFDPQIHSPKLNAAHVLSMVRPGGIIIMHDRRSYSPDQLERVLKGLTGGGWSIQSVGGLLKVAEEEKETIRKDLR